jgi:hypothetical protein
LFRESLPWIVFVAYFTPPVAYVAYRVFFSFWFYLFGGSGPTGLTASGIEDSELPGVPGMEPGRPSSGLQAARWRTVHILARITEIGLWPAWLIAGNTMGSVLPSSSGALRPRLVAYAAVSAVAATILLGVRAASGPGFGITFVALAVLATLTARHVAWLISGAEFPRLLRRSEGAPYLTLGQLAVFDFVALLALAIILLRWRTAAAFQPGWLLAEARDLMSLRHIMDLRSRSDLSPVLVVVALSVAAYWSSVAGQLVKVQSFRRNDDDRIWVAAMLLDVGRADEAERWLAPVNRDRLTSPLLRIQMRLALFRREFEDAIRIARALALLVDPTDTSADGAFVYLAGQSRAASIEQDSAWELIALAAPQRITDGALFAVLVDLEHAVGIFRSGRHESQAVRRAIDCGIEADVKPVAWSFVQGAIGRFTDSLETLERQRPVLRTDRAMWVMAKQAVLREGLARVSEPETRAQLDEVLRTMADVGVAGLPLWLRTYVIKKTWRLERAARRFALPGYSDLRRLRRTLLALPEDQAESRLRAYDVVELEAMRESRTLFDVMVGDLIDP